MSHVSRVVVTVVALVLAACANGLDTPEALDTKTRDDAFLPYIATAGKTILVNKPLDNLTANERFMLSLLARRDRKTGILTTHARIEIRYMGATHRRYSVARNDRGEVLAMSQLSVAGNNCRKDPYCMHLEEYLVNLPEPDLRAAQDKGYLFKVFNKPDGEILFGVPPQLIKALFAAADAPPATKAAAVGAAPAR